MKVIQPNCRTQFTAEDLEFIVGVLQPEDRSPEHLVQLLAEEETRDLILDDDKLFRAVLERRDCLQVSTHFYFYILVRHVLRQSGIGDREVADYVAEMLAEFSRTEALRCRVPGQVRPLDYFVDMLAALRTADEATTFSLRAHIGNHSLFITGIFPDRVRYRVERRAAPDLKFYESLGRENYRLAGDHRLAHRYHVASVFNTLAECFDATRRALNGLGDRLIAVNDLSSPLRSWLHAAWQGDAPPAAGQGDTA